jgi:hypothetical protein
MMRALVAVERGADFRLDEAGLLRRGFGARPAFGVLVAEAATAELSASLHITRFRSSTACSRCR